MDLSMPQPNHPLTRPDGKRCFPGPPSSPKGRAGSHGCCSPNRGLFPGKRVVSAHVFGRAKPSPTNEPTVNSKGELTRISHQTSTPSSGGGKGGVLTPPKMRLPTLSLSRAPSHSSGRTARGARRGDN
jgi:hypothetical protein